MEAVILAILPPIVAPLIAWFLSQVGAARRTRKLEALVKRIELLEKLRSVEHGKSDLGGRVNEILGAEIRDIIDDLEALHEVEAPREIPATKEMGSWRRFLLLYQQASLKAKIYKVLFYTFAFFGVIGGISGFAVTPGSDRWFGLVGGAFYVGVGLLFRTAAARNYERLTKKIAAREAGT